MLQIPDNPYRTLKVGGSRSGTTNALLNLTSPRPDIDQIYLHAKRSIWSKVPMAK